MQTRHGFFPLRGLIDIGSWFKQGHAVGDISGGVERTMKHTLHMGSVVGGCNPCQAGKRPG